MGGPVRKSPSEVARTIEAAYRPLDEETGLDLLPEQVPITVQPAQPLKLIEKFALQMGGVEPDKMLSTLKATAFRLPDKYRSGNWTPQEVTNEQMMALLVVANKYGLNPFIKEIYAFPDKGGIVPIVGVDGWSRMINDHEQFDGMKFVFSKEAVVIDDHAKRCPEAITCIIYRKDRSHATEITEYLDEVYRPAFEKDGKVKPGPWQSHTKRMLRHKAMIQCARIAFGFTGIHDQDEAERIVASDYVIPSDEPTQAKSLTDRFKTPPIEGEVTTKDHDDKPEPEPETPDRVSALVELFHITDDGAKPEEPKPEPEKKPAVKKKVPVKKPAPKPDPTAKFMDRIMAAENEGEVTGILTEVAEAKGLSAAKRVILKKTAEVKVKEFTNDGE